MPKKLHSLLHSCETHAPAAFQPAFAPMRFMGMGFGILQANSKT